MSATTSTHQPPESITMLLKEASELPDPNRSLLTHNESELVRFCGRLADALSAGWRVDFGANVPPLTFHYKNWRGESGVRRAFPIRTFFGSTEWHPAPQWLLEAWDLDKGALRVFAMADMAPPEPAPPHRQEKS